MFERSQGSGILAHIPCSPGASPACVRGIIEMTAPSLELVVEIQPSQTEEDWAAFRRRMQGTPSDAPIDSYGCMKEVSCAVPVEIWAAGHSFDYPKFAERILTLQKIVGELSALRQWPDADKVE